MSVDFHFIKTWLFEHMEDASFRYFLRTENTSNKLTNQGIIDAKKMFCKDLSHCICIDGSITPKQLKEVKDQGEKLLFAIPYDYQFDLYLQGKTGEIKKKDTFAAFDHMIAGSPFTEKILKDWYQWKKEDSLVKGAYYPMAYELLQEKQTSIARERTAHFYRAVEEKKVVTLILQGDKRILPDDVFVDFDLKRFMDQLPDDWFFLTNSISVINRAYQLPTRYHNSIGYLNDFLPNVNGLLIADAMITNHSYYAVQFAAKRKPVFYLDFGQSKFVQYMNQEYPALKFGKEEHYANLEKCLTLFTDEQKAFCNEFSYEQGENPYEIMGTLIEQAEHK